MARCDVCSKKKAMTMECKWCKKDFCISHLGIEAHKCENADDCKNAKKQALQDNLMGAKSINTGNLVERI